MTIRKKQRLFIDAYTDRTSPDTYDNGTKSAAYAGYSHTHGPATASQLLKRDDIKQEIARINQEYDTKHADTLENKIKIAWNLFTEAKDQGKMMIAAKWYEEHGKLSGHYVQRVDIKDLTDRTPDEKEELNGINNRIFGSQEALGQN